MNSNMVWSFGDSMTALFKDGVGSVKSYYGYLPKTTSEVIADYYKFDYKNLGKGGTGNNEIFESFLKIHNDVKKDDILIFGWTVLLRYRLGALITNQPSWVPIFAVGLQNTPEYECVDGTYVTKEVAEQILLNRDQFKTLYQNEVNYWISFINDWAKLKEVKVIHWSWCYNKFGYDQKLNLTIPVVHYTDLTTETNGIIKDGHYGEKGHYELAQQIIEYLEPKNKIKII